MTRQVHPRVVLHPRAPRGVADALRERDDISLVEPADTEGVIAALQGGAEVLATYRWDEKFLTPGLRWVACEGAGFDQFPLAAFERAGVVLTTARGVHGASVPEHAIALLLALTRRVADAARNGQTGRWEPLPATELEGQTVAVVGLGVIGEGVARRLRPFGVKLIGVRRVPSRGSDAVDRVLGPEALLDVCAATDALILALPGGPATAGMIGAAELGALGPGWLVNVARGSVVDEDALLKALTNGRLRGAGLDVVSREPLPPESPLWSLPNVVITPHTAGNTGRYGWRWIEIFERNLAAFAGEGPWVNLVVDGHVLPRVSSSPQDSSEQPEEKTS